MIGIKLVGRAVSVSGWLAFIGFIIGVGVAFGWLGCVECLCGCGRYVVVSFVVFPLLLHEGPLG